MLDLKNQKFHFIAIGGIGMSGLAKYLLEKGCEVSGSDIQDSKYLKSLKELGAKVYVGHNEDNIEGTPIIIASTAIKQDNVEIQKAKKLNLPILHRSDLLKLIAEDFSNNEKSTFIGFSGTHGKTTTSGLCSYLLAKAGKKPSYVVGGIVPDLNDNARFDSKDFFVAELDESDGTILKYQPDISVINNLEVDHVDFYTGGFGDLIKTFNTYLSTLKKDAKVIINTDCKGNRELIKQNPNTEFITFGFDDADYTVDTVKYLNFGSSFNILKDGKKLAEINLNIPGKHNIHNALAVFAALNESDIEADEFINHFSTFTGMGRRFQLSAEFNDIKVIDDYAHHPTEIKTTIESAKKATTSRVVAVFQPHRYSRLKGLWNEFLTSFDDADKLVVLDVYAASENPIKEADSGIFTKEVNHKDATYINGNMEEVARKLLPLLSPSDIVLTLGAGDITKLGILLLNEYNKRK